MTLPILKKLGGEKKICEISILKFGAEFSSSFHDGKSSTFYFRKALDKGYPYLVGDICRRELLLEIEGIWRVRY